MQQKKTSGRPTEATWTTSKTLFSIHLWMGKKTVTAYPGRVAYEIFKSQVNKAGRDHSELDAGEGPTRSRLGVLVKRCSETS